MPSAPSVRGFLLHSTYRLERGRPVLYLWGVAEGGRSFLARDRREVPHFWVEAADASRARALGAAPLRPTRRRTFGGAPVVRVEVARPAEAPALRNLLQAAGIRCYEADVPFATRYLVDRGIRGSVTLRGAAHPGDGVDLAFDDPEVAPGDWTPELEVLSFDVETDPRGRHLLSAALHASGGRTSVSEVLLVTHRGQPCPAGAVPVAGERELLETFCRRVRDIDPDVLTGWNVADFDLPVLERRARELGIPLELGRGPGPLRRREGRSVRGASRVTLPGRVVLDGLHLLAGAFIPVADYSLDTVARKVLGEGKTLSGPHHAEEILNAFHEDRERFVEYNLRDARLVTEILDRLHLVSLAVERSRLTGMPPDRVAASVASFDFLYLSELHRRRVVAPTADSSREPQEPTLGGHVLDPRPGLYENVLVLDFKSLYPSLIRTFQIDPLGFLPAPGPGDDPIVAPNGAAFRRSPGILPGLLDDLFPRREEARERGDRVTSYAIKILMNSFYGVLATPACRFSNPRIANAITAFGREILLWSKERIEARGHGVLYGDTDSLFVATGADDRGQARHLGERLLGELNRELADHVGRTWRVESHLVIELETLYLRLFLPPMRHGTAGARKRYAGLVEEADGRERVVFTGMEVVRRDWTELAHQVQRELYERLFSDRPVDRYLRRVVDDLRAGRLDDLLVYRKGLRKDPDAYTSTTPPHVAAARKMSHRPGRRVAYVITRGGPEPAGEQRSPYDYEHYLDKQILPVAEPVLTLLGLDFRKVIGDDRQLELF